MGDRVTRPTSTDQSEPSIKCSKCGAMFDFTSHFNMSTHEAVCPICGRSVNMEDAKIIDASNEEF